MKVKSVHDFATTVDLLKKDISDKGIKFFDEIDQSKNSGKPLESNSARPLC